MFLHMWPQTKSWGYWPPSCLITTPLSSISVPSFLFLCPSFSIFLNCPSPTKISQAPVLSNNSIICPFSGSLIFLASNVYDKVSTGNSVKRERKKKRLSSLIYWSSPLLVEPDTFVLFLTSCPQLSEETIPSSSTIISLPLTVGP